jgi:hypothetical protein
LGDYGVLRKAVLFAALAACLAVAYPAFASASEQLMPNVRYTRETRWIGGEPVVFHVVVAPKPGGLYGLRPVLSNERVSARETLTSMQRRLLPRANVVGVNGDFFTWAIGHPNGIFVQEGVVKSHPLEGRSSLGIGLDGLLRISRLRYAGTFRFDSHPLRAMKEFNRPIRHPRGFSLFTPAWGERTPHRSYTTEVVLADVKRTFPNVDRVGTIVRVVRGSGHRIPPGGAVLQARRASRKIVRAQALVGGTVTFRIGITSWWDGVKAAIGGGPVLVRSGQPVYNAGEWFTTTQLVPRHPRTAIGQRADGKIVLLVADGRSVVSRGLTNRQLANAMVHYGAEKAMAFDAGGSSEMAFNGVVLNRPSDGYERPLADSLQLTYIGAFARKPRFPVFSPNGDGVRDRERLAAKFVRTSRVNLKLVNPNRVTRWAYSATRDPGIVRKSLTGSNLMEGTWRWIVSGVDGKGRSSRMQRRFRLNNTLGYMTLSKEVMRVRERVGGRIRIGFRLAHTADVLVRIRKPSGRIVRRLVAQSGLGSGGYAVIWNGKNDADRVVRSGRFVARVRAENSLGAIAITKRFVVRRVS